MSLQANFHDKIHGYPFESNNGEWTLRIGEKKVGAIKVVFRMVEVLGLLQMRHPCFVLHGYCFMIASAIKALAEKLGSQEENLTRRIPQQ